MLTNTRITEIQRRAQTTFENKVNPQGWSKLLAHDILIDLIPEITELQKENQTLKMKATAWDAQKCGLSASQIGNIGKDKSLYGKWMAGKYWGDDFGNPIETEFEVGPFDTEEEALGRAAVAAGILKEMP